MAGQSQFPIILDGGMGRELQRIGAPFKQPEWSALALLQVPQTVVKAHANFIQAGAEVITTNTYALVPFHLGNKGYEKSAASLIKQAAQLARSAVTAHKNVSVAGCLPPVLGSYRPDLFKRELALPLLQLLIEKQRELVDFWLAETISSIAEARLIKELTSETGKSTWMAFTINDDLEKEPCLRSGEPVFEAISQIAGEHVDAVLFNCSRPEAMMAAIIEAKRALKSKGLTSTVLIGVYANSFAPISDEHEANASITELREDLTAEQYCTLAAQWVAGGASIIGGCCGISPEHIAHLSRYKADKIARAKKKN